MSTTLVLYAFHQYNDRVNHFINNCVFDDDNVDFILISNNKYNQFSCPKYVQTLFRDNIGFDFGAWSDALLTNDLYKYYDNFIFVNSSVIGPYLSPTYKGKWTDIYLNGLRDNIKLFGSTINTIENPLEKSHVQSYIFSMDKPALEYLIKCEIFSLTNYAITMDNAIQNKEILMSLKILEHGWNIGSLLPCYKDVDFTFRSKKPEEYGITFFGDIMCQECRNKLWTEYDLVFVKGNRVTI